MKDLNGEISLNFWNKLKYLLSDPNFFFDSIKAEDGIGRSLLMYVIVGAFMSVVSFVLFFISTSFITRSFGGFGTGLASFIFPLLIVAVLIIGLIFTFIFSGLIHAVVIAFKGEGVYVDTYNVYTYSTVPALILVVIPIVGLLSFVYSLILMIIGVSRLHNISNGKAAIACLTPIFFMIGLIGFLIISILL